MKDYEANPRFLVHQNLEKEKQALYICATRKYIGSKPREASLWLQRDMHTSRTEINTKSHMNARSVTSISQLDRIARSPIAKQVENGSRIIVLVKFISPQQFIFVVHHMSIVAPARRKGAPSRVRALIAPAASTNVTADTAPEARGQQG